MIRIIAGGKKHAKWLEEACTEYEKRLRKPFNLEWVFVDEEKIAEKVARLDMTDFVIVLDEKGKIMSSVELSDVFTKTLISGCNIVIVIGGAFGHFSPSVTERANLIWSLSKLVFPHQICRLLVSEQIYRAQEISLEHKYHHA